MPSPDILLVTFDDLWIGDVTPALMPNYTAFVQYGGARAYTRCYSMPLCSQSRACMTFGKYGRNLGIIDSMGVVNGPEPAATAATLPLLLQDAGYQTCLVGKWHLGRNPFNLSAGYLGAPEARGYDWWLAGTPSNVDDFYNWLRVDGDEVTQETNYLTIEQVSSATAWWSATQGPRFMHVALNAPHGPYHLPPPETLGGFQSFASTLNRRMYESEIRSADWAFGQIISSVGLGAVIIATSDNGCPPNATPSNAGMAGWKGTTYEGGIRVPLAVRSQFGGGASDRLVHLVDLPASILSLSGIPKPSDWDSSSLYSPQRQVCISEAQVESSGAIWRAAMTKRYKLVVTGQGQEELYDLQNDPDESDPLDKTDSLYASTLATLRGALG